MMLSNGKATPCKLLLIMDLLERILLGRNNKMKNPTVFISYSWDSPGHKNWVIALANELRRNGINAKVDEFITQKGTVNLNRMMIENISRSDYTIVVLTDRYADKSNEFKGGVGYETSLLINSMVENIDKIIPIMRYKGDKNNAIPYYLKGVSYIEFSDDNEYDEKIEELKHKILKVDMIEMEPLGEVPNLKPKRIVRETLHKEAFLDNDLIPNLREITDRDKSKFMNESYSEIINYLEEIAEHTKKKNSNFDYNIDVVTNKKTIFRYYLNGMEKYATKIWLGDFFSRQESILLSNGRVIYDNDNSCNEMIVNEINQDKKLKLKFTMGMFIDKKLMDVKEISQEIWRLRNFTVGNIKAEFTKDVFIEFTPLLYLFIPFFTIPKYEH